MSGTLTIIEFTINVVANETRLVATSLGQLLGPLHLQRGGLNKANGRNEATQKRVKIQIVIKWTYFMHKLANY